MQPSKGFLRSLQIFDADLSVRWSYLHNQWLIERDGFIPETELWFLERRAKRLRALVDAGENVAKHSKMWREVVEELDAAKRGRRIVFYTDELNDKVFNMLGLADIRRYGGYSRFADEREQFEKRQENDQERAEEQKRMALHKETLDMVNWLVENRSDELANGERNMNKLLHGKRSNKPIITPEEYSRL